MPSGKRGHFSPSILGGGELTQTCTSLLERSWIWSGLRHPCWHCRRSVLHQLPGQEQEAAYAGDLVRVFCRIWDANSKSVQVAYGFPLLSGGLVDDSIIWGLREVELCVDGKVDKHRLSSFPDTLCYSINTYLSTSGGQSCSYKVTPLRNWLLFKVISNGFVSFKISVTSNCNGTVTLKSR
jgi:hypothetical protein